MDSVKDDAPAMSAADAPTKSAASIETQLTAKDAPVEDQPAVDINPINTKGKHPEYPGHNQPAMAIPNSASSISYIHAIDTTQFGHNRDKTGNNRSMIFKENPQHLYGQQSLNGSLPCTASTMRYGSMDGNIPRRKEWLEEQISLLCNK